MRLRRQRDDQAMEEALREAREAKERLAEVFARLSRVVDRLAEIVEEEVIVNGDPTKPD